MADKHGGDCVSTRALYAGSLSISRQGAGRMRLCVWRRGVSYCLAVHPCTHASLSQLPPYSCSKTPAARPSASHLAYIRPLQGTENIRVNFYYSMMWADTRLHITERCMRGTYSWRRVYGSHAMIVHGSFQVKLDHGVVVVIGHRSVDLADMPTQQAWSRKSFKLMNGYACRAMPARYLAHT